MPTEQIEFNGEIITLETPLSIREFLNQQSPNGRFVLVLNDEVINVSLFDEKQINNGDRVEILSPISGG